MELNSKSIAALKSLASEDDYSEENFNHIILYIFNSYFVNINNGKFEINLETEKLEKLGRKTAAEIKETIASVYMFITEYARYNTDITSAGYLIMKMFDLCIPYIV